MSGVRTMLRNARIIRGAIFICVPLFYLFYSSLSTGASELVTSVPGHTLQRRQLLAKWESEQINCTPAAILDFPQDLFTDAQRRQGAAFLHALLALYLFILLAYVCDDYFVPAIEKIVEVLGVSDDVGGATLMAAATSSPELFINVVGTFVTQGDLGVGAVLGSAVFNILAVPACCGIFASKEIVLDWWPMTRDCAVYALSVVWLIICLDDELVYWYEAAGLVTFYLCYIVLMYYNVRVAAWARKVCSCLVTTPPLERTPLLVTIEKQDAQILVTEDSLLSWLKELPPGGDTNKQHVSPTDYIPGDVENTEKCQSCMPWHVITSPIRSVLWMSIPDCRLHTRLYPLTFLMCVVWIGSTTYVLTWMITVIGDTLRIPDSVMGITFLAAGTSVPEAVSSVIVTRQGHGGMGISNSLGSNTFDILLCLGIPWLIKSSMLALDEVATHEAIRINSQGLEYDAISLLMSTLLLFTTFAFYRFRLNFKVGVACLVLYVIFLMLATLIELNVFSLVNLPMCEIR